MRTEYHSKRRWLPQVLREIIASDFYRSDYDNVTSYFVHQKVEYEAALEQLQLLADSGIF